MDTGSVLSEPVHYPHLRGFPKERSTSMTIISPKTGKPRMSQLENLEAKMANIEVSLSSANHPGRRRKGTSLGGISVGGGSNGNISALSAARASPRPGEPKELRTALQDREAVIQNLRIQLGLGKLPRPTGPPLDDIERPAAEQKLSRLKIDAENKRIAIRNLKSALDKLDITDNIDIRIRQAELEYALGREELQLLSIVEEVRALQTRLDKAKPELSTLYSLITSGVNLTLHAVHATTGRWAANIKSDSVGIFVEWALDGEGLYRGDRILEVNGKIITCRTKEELQKQIGTTGKCQLVVIRKKSSVIPQQHVVQQQQEDNQRLQHRISYLEEQVRELQTTKESSPPPPPLPSQSTHPAAAASIPNNNNHNNKLVNGINGNGSSGHVTSISISSPSTTANSSPTPVIADKPLVYQRGNYVTTLLGGKPIELTGNSGSTSKSHITKTLIHENGGCSERLNGSHTDTESNNYKSTKSLSASKISINSDLQTSSSAHHHQHHQQHNLMGSSSTGRKRGERYSERALMRNGKLSSDFTNQLMHSHGSHHLNHRNGNSYGNNICNGNGNMHARSVEHLNYNGIDRRKEILRSEQARRFGNDLRSVKSLDFESDSNEQHHSNHHYHHQNHHYSSKRNVDYTSEPVAPRVRPTPPKKPLRLSLQRAQSLQTVELLPVSDAERKRSLKRAHFSEKLHDAPLIENVSPLHTASLGRHKHI